MTVTGSDFVALQGRDLERGADTQALRDELATARVLVVAAPADGPFGRMFTFTDPDGYAVTIRDQP